MENNNNGGFSYIYSAKDQAELKRIREKYTDGKPEEDKMERVRRLDNGVTQRAQIVGLVFGIVGVLILGFGMSLIMSELDTALGLGETAALILGIVTGIIGGALAGLAYPLYNIVLKRRRAKIAPEILRLTEELMK